MPNIYVDDGGTWRTSKELFINDSGTWRTAKTVYANVGGTWRQIYPESTNSQSYTTPGTYQFTVPNGIYKVTFPLIVAGGGGGGGSIFSGDGHGAANGGSGGYYKDQVVTTRPGDVFTVIVGAGGLAPNLGNGTQGNPGGASQVYKNGVLLFTATGGYGGNGVTGDNAPNNSSPANGSAGGTPNGVPGSYQASWMVNRNTNGQGFDGLFGLNGTGYGNGGLGGNSGGGGASGGNGLVGSPGFISISW